MQYRRKSGQSQEHPEQASIEPGFGVGFDEGGRELGSVCLGNPFRGTELSLKMIKLVVGFPIHRRLVVNWLKGDASRRQLPETGQRGRRRPQLES